MIRAFDVVVVGAGHAGAEAAAIAARLGRRVACVTFRREHVGRLSCNPAVGGQGKGHLVREIDALGGVMARVADASCVQFRRLNTRKGLAVQASRAQVDIDRYPAAMRATLEALPGLELVEAEVASVLYELSADAYERIKVDNPALSRSLLAYIIRVMAERLSFASRAIGVLQR